MDKNLNKLWKTVLGEIETEVSRANFLTLFKTTALLSLEDNTATIATPSNMIIDLLQKRFLQIIKKTLDKHTGKDIHIVFVPKIISGESDTTEESGPLFSENNKGDALRVENKPLSKPLIRVRPEYTFGAMAVSSSNQLAYVSAQTVAKNLGTSYNPLFIYGPTGVGKTHLMQAIANEVCQKNPAKTVIYTTSEEFTNEVVEAIRTNNTSRMKKKFRNTDLLIIDDIQFMAGKDRVQEELFHTFNILIDNASQIVLSSDRPPSEIKKLEKRLSSRFSSGLTVDVEPPDFELKTAILLIKARKYGIELPIEAAKIIAERIEDVRSLEGTLLRVITEAKTKNEEISVEMVTKILINRGGSQESARLHPDEIIKGVCQFYRIKSTQLKGPKRDAFLVKARQITMYLLKKELNLTLVEIGNIIGGRDHTTIMHGIEKIDFLLSLKENEKSTLSMEIVGITKFLSTQKGSY